MKINKFLIFGILAVGFCAEMIAFRGGGRSGGRSMGGGGARSMGAGRGAGIGGAGRSRGTAGMQRPGGLGRPGQTRPSTGLTRRGGYGQYGKPSTRPGYGRPGAGYPGYARPGVITPGMPGYAGLRPGAGQRPGVRPGVRPGQPGAGRPGQGLRPGKPGTGRPGRLDPNKTFRQDANRNPQRLNQQKAFMNRRFDARHDFKSLYRRNFRRYMGLFPFAFYQQYGYYPPIYYDYYDQNGVYPQEDPNYDAYASGEMPLDFEPADMGPEEGYGPPPMGFGQGYGAGQYAPAPQGAFVDYAGEPTAPEQGYQYPFGQTMADEEQPGPDEVAQALQEGEACLNPCAQDCLSKCSKNRLLSAQVCQQQCANICTQQCQRAVPAA